jgi:hypothetical protein
MGADLYIKNLPRKPQHTGFRTDIDLGYYRHAYNRSDVLWQFGLSWWTDVAKTLTTEDKEEGCIMTPEQAQQFLDLMKSKEKLFEHNLALMLTKHNPIWDYKDEDKKFYKSAEISLDERKKWVIAYKEDYEEFKKYLNKAIQMGSPIICSL